MLVFTSLSSAQGQMFRRQLALAVGQWGEMQFHCYFYGVVRGHSPLSDEGISPPLK